MNIEKAKEINKIISHIFSNELQSNKDELFNIYKEQMTLTGTPNFLYKSESYIIHKNSKLLPIAAKLKPRMSAYLSTKELINSTMSDLYTYLSINYPKLKSNADLYSILPECIHPILENGITRKGEVTLESKPDRYEEISAMLQQVLLMRLL